MRIELQAAAFQPISITLETQDDVNLFNNLIILARENTSITEQEDELAEGLEDFLGALTTNHIDPSVETPE